ncbi:hypothetical protein NIES4073_76060 [Kalymmatonema gypsitolerans NIES-4073]|uniref:hypothetical protein n=1 Tax=Scytonema sp. PCC 10023 TaxID=1680591 RepID=UPI000B5EF955|nr:hypothetical protein NIES4073_76060 [Scytonema sp. NIES-4073]
MSTGKGKKRTKNQPVLYEGLKKCRGIYLTDVAWSLVQETAIKSKISASEYIEQLIRKSHGR